MRLIEKKCPNCGKEFSLSIINDTIKCENCGNEIRVDECYNLSANNNESKVLIDRIDLWYNYQRKEVKKEIKAETEDLSKKLEEKEKKTASAMA